MRNQLKILLGLLLSLFALNSYAIQVNVQSPSQGVSALGFQVNGSNHGAAGHYFGGSNMPTGGTYKFGVRVNGLMGTDVPCPVAGKRAVVLKRNATAVLLYNGKGGCVAKIR